MGHYFKVSLYSTLGLNLEIACTIMVINSGKIGGKKWSTNKGAGFKGVIQNVL